MSARIWKTRRAKRFSVLGWLRRRDLSDDHFCVVTGVDTERRTVTIQSAVLATWGPLDEWTKRWAGVTT